MKPKDLKAPFSWGEEFTTISDRVLFAFERFGVEPTFRFPEWSDPSLFGNDRPVKIEYCSGTGQWISHQAKNDPESNWVAVEKQFDRVKRIWSKLKNFDLNNLFCVCGEALNVTKRYFADETVSEVYINFPDPWPKKRHAKYRLIQPSFVDHLERILKKGGTVTLVTDDESYSIEMIEAFNAHPGFTSIYPEPYFRTDWEEYGPSFFDELWRKKGKTIRFHQFRKERI